MRIYVAGPWVRRPEIREIAKQFEAAGHEVTSRWLYEHEGDPNDASGSSSPVDYIRFQAREDVYDVRRSQAFVIINLQKSEGKAVELGVALSAGIPVYSVGPRFNIFCSLGTEVETVQDVLNLLAPSTSLA